MLKNFRTYQLAKAFSQDCQTLELKKPYKDQFDRAVLSIVLNLAEGSGKPTRRDRQRFYSISLGSLREVLAILELTENEHLFEQADRLGACLFRLIQRPGGS